MKILIPAFTSPDSFADNVASTLRLMGHDVVTLGKTSNAKVASPVRRLARAALHKVAPTHLPPLERLALKYAKDTKADLVLALTQTLSEESLSEFKRLGVSRCVAWWGDAPANMHGMGLLSDRWDAIFLKDRSAVEKFRRVGLEAHHLHEAMNPGWHRPIVARRNDVVAIAGSFYGYRQFLTRRLIAAEIPVALYGSRLPRWVAPEIARQHSGRFIVGEEKSRVFGAALGCLNSTSLSEGNSLNCRAFEIAGAGGLQLLEFRPAVVECFDPGHELLVFNTLQELLALIAWAREDIKGAQQVRDAGARRALAHHTYEHRLRVIISAIA